MPKWKMFIKVIFLGTVELPLKSEVVQAPRNSQIYWLSYVWDFFIIFLKKGRKKQGFLQQIMISFKYQVSTYLS